MNWGFVTLLASICVICQCEEILNSYNENIKPSEDTKNLRKALLKAIEQLENDSKRNTKNTQNLKALSDAKGLDLLTSDIDQRNLAYSRKIRDKISKQEATITSVSDVNKDDVFIHTFSVNPQNDNRDNFYINQTDFSKDRISKLSQKKYANDNFISASVTSSISDGSSDNKLFNNPPNHKPIYSVLPTPAAPVTQKTKLTSPSPTISTPTEEDETKAKVEDVQFIHAPLVAAFTVEQDDKGLPRKVIPIFGNKSPQRENKIPSHDPIRQYQASLEEQQRSLEQQIKNLQEQRLQQELLLKQQQFFHEQKLLEQKQRQLLEEQQKLFTTSPLLLSEVNTFEKQNFFESPKDISGTVVALQPSISFQPNNFQPTLNQNPLFQHNQLHLTTQSLPVKAPVNFQNIPNSNTFTHITHQQVPHQFQQHSFSNDNYLQEFLYRQRTLVPPPRSNRVFRQENKVGNFGLNSLSRNNQYDQRLNSANFRPINDYTFHNNQFFNEQRNNHHSDGNFFANSFSNPQNQRNNIDKRLKSLIYQSGLGQGRSQEDLNIVSKVLALDHTGHQNFLFGESNVSERRIPFRHFDRKRIIQPGTV